MSTPSSHRATRRLRPKHLAMSAVALGVATALTLALTQPARVAEAAAAPVDQGLTAIQEPGYPTSFAQLIETVKPAVVSIASKGHMGANMPQGMTPPKFDFPPGSPFEKFFREFRERGPSQEMPRPEVSGLGSGFIIDPAGYVVTNNHVVENAEEIAVILDDGTRHEAALIGRDPKTDLALLKIETDEELPYVRFAESNDAKVGDWVVAVGNPFGLGGTATAGIISARGRDIRSGPYDDYLQIDAPINQGNSGGPLFDTKGRVIGVNTAIFSPSGGNVGIGFAIPADLAEPVLAELKSSGRVDRGWLGVHIQGMDESLAESLGLEETKGALVSQVNPDSPAEQAGLQPGDVILDFAGKPVADVRSLPRIVAATDAGEKVKVHVWRDGKRHDLEVTVGQMPGGEQLASAGKAQKGETSKLGLTLSALSPEARARLDLAENETGVLIVDVAKDSPAAKGGLRPGDVIKRVGRKEVDSVRDVTEAVETDDDAKTVLRLVKRDGVDRFVA
ncbi:MAG: DegQ family serine endoprotease, partial [Gammaproteobacteria bacterium]|nr:DegQ family serine endoprotease [Gammaproteobacteria bacterium]